ncbi:hypothetical protein LSH36_18g08014 [Paralvinella palmiformis]|uniref:Uncharacterized protein n=1 Tax=Paralvinella palmiformis TaxID=53620 RepID=A0AAD9KAX7_9ANNE|nr:hypothetical protein LSH36_18g08014 [Paralvinella palmiformis]
MPAGVPWVVYVPFATAAMVSMFAGAQLVHLHYQPLSDLEDMVKVEREKLLKEREKQNTNNIFSQ